MRTGRGYQQRAFGGDLPLHLGQIGIGQHLAQQALGLIRRNRRLAVEVGGDFQQVLDGNHREAGRQAGFLGIGLGHY